MVAGCSLESMSYRYGGFHDGCVEYEVVTGAGERRLLTPDDELFHMVHGSYGIEQGSVVVTRNGKPAAALVYLDEELLEDFVLVHHPKLLGEVEAAKGEYLKKGGISHEAMKNRLLRRRG